VDAEPVRLWGLVERGRGRGRRLGFPTANLSLDGSVELPRGVYAARARWRQGDGTGSAAAVVNVGERPTFAERGLSVEIHVLDFEGELYGRFMDVTLVEKLRDEQRFGRVEDLVEQIRKDITRARAVLASRPDEANHTEV